MGEHTILHSPQNPDYSDNPNIGSFGTFEKHNFDVYNGVLTVSTVNNVCKFPWKFKAKANGQVGVGDKEHDGKQ